LLIVASSSYLMERVDKYLPNIYRYGDLYLFSNIKKFKQERTECPVYQNPQGKINNVNFFLIGDSYTQYMPPSNFRFNQYTFTHWDIGITQIDSLDKSKKNILVIESTERYVRWRFNTAKAKSLIVIGASGNQDKKSKEVDIETYFKWQAEDNLDYILDYNDFAFFFKEIKAAINYYVFDKLDKRVTITNDEKYIFYSETTDSTLATSSFNSVTKTQVDTMVNNINDTYRYYKKSGFDEIYLAIVPNAISINMPKYGKYNNLIERIQNHKALQMPVLNIYDVMTKASGNLYYMSDGHWNCEGQKVFLKALYDCEQVIK